MALTVKQLIAQLRKQDQNALVVWQNHDQDLHECDGYVSCVAAADETLLNAEGKSSVVVLTS